MPASAHYISANTDMRLEAYPPATSALQAIHYQIASDTANSWLTISIIAVTDAVQSHKSYHSKSQNMRLLLTIILLNIVANAKAQECAISGKALHWAADYCMYSIETDDFAHPKVAECFQKQRDPSPRNMCSAKSKYKKAICKIVVKNGSYQGSVRKCELDKNFTGPTVRNGEI